MTPERPEKIGRYEIRMELGRGSIGVAYQAFDPDLERPVAVKTMSVPPGLAPRDRESLEDRFFAEARIAARLAHPGIVVVHETGRTPETGLLYMVLEYLDGLTLAELLHEGPLAWRTALYVVAGVAEALDYAHGEGVIHRDIKPENIMVLADGEPKVMDFGIAKVETARMKLTMSGQFFGTPLYMSPEQALGMPADHRVDVFALGAVLYQALTGRLAFGADTIGKIVGKVMLDDPAPPSTLVSGVPSDADYIVARALAKDRDHRYPSAHDLAQDITDLLAGLSPRGRETWLPPLPGPLRQLSEPQIASLRRGAFLPPAVEELTPEEDVPWTANLHRSMGGTVVSTARHRGLPSSPRKAPAEPPAAVEPEPVPAPAPAPAPFGEWPTLVVDPAAAAAIRPARPTTPTAPPAPAAAQPAPKAAPKTAPMPAAEPAGKKRNATGLAVGVAGLVAGVGIGALAVAFLKPGLFESAFRKSTPVASTKIPAAAHSTLPPAEAPPSPSPSAEETAVMQDTPATPEPAPTPLEEVVLVPQATPEPTPSPSRKPRRRPVRPSPSPAATSTPPRYAKLAIAFEHPLEEGTLRVWVDDELMLDEPLDSQKTKKVLVFKGRKGSLAQVLEVLPGDHEIRVEVAWDDNVKTKRISGTFDAETTRRLSAKVGGLLKKGLSLKWE